MICIQWGQTTDSPKVCGGHRSPKPGQPAIAIILQSSGSPCNMSNLGSHCVLFVMRVFGSSVVKFLSTLYNIYMQLRSLVYCVVLLLS